MQTFSPGEQGRQRAKEQEKRIRKVARKVFSFCALYKKKKKKVYGSKMSPQPGLMGVGVYEGGHSKTRCEAELMMAERFTLDGLKVTAADSKS